MCLAIPGKIIEINGDKVIVDYKIEKRNAYKTIDVNIGDYVIVKAGFIIDKIDKKQAEDFIEELKNA